MSSHESISQYPWEPSRDLKREGHFETGDKTNRTGGTETKYRKPSHVSCPRQSEEEGCDV